MYIEHVQLMVSLDYSRRGDLTIYLTSPMGTKSCLLSPRSEDLSDEGFSKWPFMTTHSWGEDPRGVWTLEIKDLGDAKANHGVVTEWQLILHGTKLKPNHQLQAHSTEGHNERPASAPQPAPAPANHAPSGPTFTFIPPTKETANSVVRPVSPVNQAAVTATHALSDHLQINISDLQQQHHQQLQQQQQQQQRQQQQQQQQRQQQQQQLQQQARKKQQQLQLQLQKQQQEQAQLRQMQKQQQQQNIRTQNIYSNYGPQGTNFIAPQAPRVPFADPLPGPYFGPRYGPPAPPPMEPNIALSNNGRLRFNQMRWGNPLYRAPAIPVNPYSGYLRTYGKRGARKPHLGVLLLRSMKRRRKYKL